MYGHDFYYLNFSGDIPFSALDSRIEFIILKYTQGTYLPSSVTWARRQAPLVRQHGMKVGSYHMLDGGGSSGAAQANYFLQSCNALEQGDIVPALDFEGSGQGSDSLADYRSKAVDYIKTMHGAGFQVMLYGHSTVKAAWNDWRDSGADYWWCPGSQLWTDVGPVGPDLWQYGPYAPSVGPCMVNGRPMDASKVITSLPVIGGNDEMAYADYRAGVDAAQDKALKVNFGDIGAADTGKPKDFQAGWNDVRWQVNRLKGRDGVDGKDGKDGAAGPAGPAGPVGPAGPKGDKAVIAVGSKLEIVS